MAKYKVFYKCVSEGDEKHRVLWIHPIEGHPHCQFFCGQCSQPMILVPPTTDMIDRLLEQSVKDYCLNSYPQKGG